MAARVLNVAYWALLALFVATFLFYVVMPNTWLSVIVIAEAVVLVVIGAFRRLRRRR
jgi:hypothetical protein